MSILQTPSDLKEYTLVSLFLILNKEKRETHHSKTRLRKRVSSKSEKDPIFTF
jgi:hypothetical protein